MLLYVVVVTLVITLTPFDFAVPERWRVTIADWTVLDLIANVLLFVPVGFLLALGEPAARPGTVWRALAVGALLSLVIESAQLFELERYTSPWDVLTNAAGAALGGALPARLRRRLDPAALVGRLALELPLVGLVYLLVPLAWLRALAGGAGAARLWPLVVLGLFGGSLLGAVQRRYFGPAGLASPRAMGAVAAGWFAVASVPAVGTAPAMVAAGVLLVGLFTWHRAAAPPPASGEERRFERASLLRASPFFAAYLLLLPLTALDSGGYLAREYVIGIVESAAAFTVLGYMAAEAMGRREHAFGVSWLPVALLAAMVALLDGVLRAAGLTVDGTIATRALASVLSAVYGGWLYHLQRDQVRRLAQPGPGLGSSGIHDEGGSGSGGLA
ncbi:MAG: VanZ family protein [Gemmatimonadaceae bacterium]